MSHVELQFLHQIGIFRLLQSLNRDSSMTLITVLHDLTAAAAFCESVALMNQGRLIRQGKPVEVITTEIIRNIYGADVLVHPSLVGGLPQISYAPE